MENKYWMVKQIIPHSLERLEFLRKIYNLGNLQNEHVRLYKELN